MQAISYADRMSGKEEELIEYFRAQTYEEVKCKMDKRVKEVESFGEIQTIRRQKIGRNQACPCGSGKKFKKCCIDKAR